MKKYIILLALLALTLTGATYSVFAEEVPSEPPAAEEAEKSELAVWFEEKIEPHLFEFAAALIGAGSVVLVAVGKIRKALGALKSAKTSYEDSAEARKQELEKLKAETLKAYEQAVAEIQKTGKEIQSQLSDRLFARLSEIEEKVQRDIEMNAIAYENMPQLVCAGHAKKIAELAEGGKKDVDESQT